MNAIVWFALGSCLLGIIGFVAAGTLAYKAFGGVHRP
jgi:hypothetical protein